MSDNITSTDPANEGSLEGVLKTALNKLQQSIQIMLPCIVTSVDRDKNKVSVLPLIDIILANGQYVQRAEISNIPISNLSAGGFIINFPVKVGDYGYIKTCDRDISLFKQSFNRTKPNTLRKNSFEDGVFIPDVINYSKYSIASEDIENLVIQSYDNTTKISLGAGKIILQADEIEYRAKVSSFTGEKVKLQSNEISLQSDVIKYQASSNLFTGGTITHDGTSIDKTHIHAQGADDAGDAEQDTTPPIN